MVTLENVFGMRIGSMIRGGVDKIHEINKKYETPRIKMSRGVRIALLFLRLYLILLVLLLGYKFWTLL
jgi:hypothetical protein|nr:hypothetical protein [uncultured Methanoregula sp.]